MDVNARGMVLERTLRTFTLMCFIWFAWMFFKDFTIYKIWYTLNVSIANQILINQLQTLRISAGANVLSFYWFSKLPQATKQIYYSYWFPPLPFGLLFGVRGRSSSFFSSSCTDHLLAYPIFDIFNLYVFIQIWRAVICDDCLVHDVTLAHKKIKLRILWKLPRAAKWKLLDTNKNMQSSIAKEFSASSFITENWGLY